MIKRITTLLASLALILGLFANAQTPIKLVVGSNAGLYQLSVQGGVLGVNGDGALVVANANGTTTGVPLENTLWCVKVTQENSGKDAIFDFLNKGAQVFLDVTMDEFNGNNATPTSTAAILGGEIGGWAFSSTFETAVEPAQPMYSYFRSDSVVGLVVNGTNVTLKTAVSSKAGIAAANFTPITLQTVAPQTLTASQINTKLGLLSSTNKKVTLTFVPDKNKTSLKNPFNDSDAPFYAKASNEANFVNIYRSADDSVLFVDTAYTNINGSKFLAFKYAKDLTTIGTIADQAKFLFTYFPTNDSLVIQVKQAIYQAANGSFIANTTLDKDNKSVIATNADVANFVTVQDLIKVDSIRIVTIHNVKESDINLGYGNCKISSDLTSLKDSVYTIQNEKGQYLSIPIQGACYQKGDPIFNDDMYEPAWVTVDSAAQKVERMPAYQWVVLKTKTNAYFDSISPIKVYNREFPGVTAVVQLKKDSKGNIIASSTSNNRLPYFLDGIKLTITGLPASSLTNPTMGYKYMSKEELMTTKYALNYFNPYNMDKYVAMNADSTLNVMSDKAVYFSVDTAYGLNAGTLQNYGIDVKNVVGDRIKSLAQLQRIPYLFYTIGSKGEHMGLGRDYQNAETDEYLTIKQSLNNNHVNEVFFLKENNNYKGTPYYALLQAMKASRTIVTEKTPFLPMCFKVGVADQTLNALLQWQCGCEDRTSAFALTLGDTPLYRHFNNANLGEVEGTDTLKFYENVRHEYLIDENNDQLRNTDWEKANNHTIDYLGIWTANKASLNGTALGLRLDTVWVNRGLGNIKPQYLISVAHHDQGAIKGDSCTEKTNTHITPDGHPTSDPWACVHATPGRAAFDYGKYLISFADSTDDIPYTDVKEGYYRLAFKPAIHIADTLILLDSDDQLVAPDSLNPAVLIAKYKSAAYKKAPKGGAVIDLTGDLHKNVTWSFRYVNPSQEAAITTTESAVNSFLIESNIDQWTDENGVIHYYDKAIAPNYASWVKMQNGCLTLTTPWNSSFENAKTGGDGALIFNVEKMTANDNLVTDAAAVTASVVTVIAGQGQVTINGAAGKKVVISNILGQTVANTVLSSDNATIAAPAGVVVVAVEGEAAVKAIVK